MAEVPLTGYTDKLSARPGETLNFYLSAVAPGTSPLPAEEEDHDDDVDAVPTPVPPPLQQHTVRARLVRSICADPNPKGPGIIEEDVSSQWLDDAATKIPLSVGRQEIRRGSYAQTRGDVNVKDAFASIQSVTVQVWVYPTLLKPIQCIWKWGHDDNKKNGCCSTTVYLLGDGRLRIKLRIKNSVLEHETDEEGTVKLKTWHCVKLIMSSNASYKVMVERVEGDELVEIPFHFSYPGFPVDGLEGSFRLSERPRFNGRMENPSIHLIGKPTIADTQETSSKIEYASWNTAPQFSAPLWSIPCSGLASTIDTSASDLVLRNHPTRGIKGLQWDGTEFCWSKREATKHYGAIHFHEDDVYDFGWTSNLQWKVPSGIPSGVYIMRFTMEADGHQYEEALPLFICPENLDEDEKMPLAKVPRVTEGAAPTKSTPKKLAVLIPTFTYVMYGNHSRPDFEQDLWKARTEASAPGSYPYNPSLYPLYGWSTYNFHSDQSGIHFASHRRPLFNLRPGYISFSRDGGYHKDEELGGDGEEYDKKPTTSPSYCSGLRHFPADSHLIAWLHHHNIDYDIVTDHLLHKEGVDAISKYASILTSSHPEYHTVQTLDALQHFRDRCGGNLVYLGGNGFYWKIAVGPSTVAGEDVHLLEIRRCEGGVRTWASEPGEYYNFLDGGSMGGLWRNSARPPSKLVGVGFSSQGSFVGKPYHRVCFDKAMDWVFKGIPSEESKILGNFGYSGNGAAGYELDRIDPTDLHQQEYHNFVILAQAWAGSDERFILVPEEVLTPWTNTAGLPMEEAKRADMVYFRCESGAQVFSVGSITFCGCLPFNNFDNSISRLVKNVVDQFTGHAKS